ncbi:hypothetical protein [Bacillus sp. ISL-39]|uniref:hypothetical protein n=1 Tax=Bacillus sp. ISL-39 TaxID=2819124 RepID=UPI001BEC91F5|nr:hypothetical protein [Bacillus sp. ISL-39]MBT2638028.1 hypothetical protein [Bacillus sp. ISL-39]
MNYPQTYFHRQDHQNDERIIPLLFLAAAPAFYGGYGFGAPWYGYGRPGYWYGRRPWYGFGRRPWYGFGRRRWYGRPWW